MAKSEFNGAKIFEVRPSPIHGLGAFALVAIGAGTRVCEYLGERISKAESLRRCEAGNEYIFALDETYDLDGNVEWNPARFLNHCCEPNCEAVLDEGRAWIGAVRGIAPGDELTFNYGFDLVDFRDYPCRCRAAGCAGYIVAEEYLDEVRRKS